MCKQFVRLCRTLLSCSADKLSVSTETPQISKPDSDIFSQSLDFYDAAGVHESTTETLFKEHNSDLGGIAMARADRLYTLTGTFTVLPGDLNETTLGHSVRFPGNKVSVYSVNADSKSPVLRAGPCIVFTSYGTYCGVTGCFNRNAVIA